MNVKFAGEGFDKTGLLRPNHSSWYAKNKVRQTIGSSKIDKPYFSCSIYSSVLFRAQMALQHIYREMKKEKVYSFIRSKEDLI